MVPRAKGKSVYLCDACGNESLRWEGRCRACGQWNALVEVPAARTESRRDNWTGAASSQPQELSDVSTKGISRLCLSSGEFNRVLGGGIVPGSLTLIAGDPGIGKSTLLLRLAADVASGEGKTLYISGEESAAQVKLRAERMGISGRNLYLLPVTSLTEMLARLQEYRPALAVVDSIQTAYDDSISAEAGSVTQIRACTRGLMEWAKSSNVPLILSGHVTKGGDIAGPRVMEHMVDVVLYMEGESVSAWRLLRTIKNRFGSTNEVGIFEMTDAGLVDVADPSMAFLAERRAGSVGSVIVSTLEGSRPLLVEVQALSSPSVQPTPRRVASGIDFNRLLLVCAVLTRRLGISMANQDIVVNVTGGLRVSEPAADLGVALAIASSIRNVPVDPEFAAIGELGLSGEVRMVPQLERRIKEVERLGLKHCVAPGKAGDRTASRKGATTVVVDNLVEAVDACIPRSAERPRGRRRIVQD